LTKNGVHWCNLYFHKKGRSLRRVSRLQACSQSIDAVDEVLRRLSFGLNGGETPRTSVAVAYGLTLNYLSQVIDSRVLPEIFRAEPLQGSFWDSQRYPQTGLLHTYLLTHFDLKPGPLGLWGAEVVRRLKHFWRANPWRLGVVVRSGFGGYGAETTWKLVKQSIDSGYPAMVTTPHQCPGAIDERPYTMLACGYRITAFGQREVLVHSGSYGDSIKGSRIQLHYLPLRHLLCGYRFDVALLSSAL
jgi:hypothetical protein